MQDCEQQFVALKNDPQNADKTNNVQYDLNAVRASLSKLREAENTVSRMLGDTTKQDERHWFAQAWNNETSNTINASFQTYQTMSRALERLKSEIEIVRADNQQETSVQKEVDVEVPNPIEVAKPHAPGENRGSALPDQPFSWFQPL